VIENGFVDYVFYSAMLATIVSGMAFFIAAFLCLKKCSRTKALSENSREEPQK